MEDLGHSSAAKRPAQRLISASRNTTQEHRASYGPGVGLTSGEVVGISDGIGDGLPVAEGDSAGVGNAKVGAGEGEGVGDSLGDEVIVGEETGVGVGDRVGAAGVAFSVFTVIW